jgi:hypothetical protein
VKAYYLVWAVAIAGLAAAGWLAAGILAVIVVLVVAVLVVSYRWRSRAGGWRSGRPTSQRRRAVDGAIAAKLPGRDRPEPDPVEAWIRERSLYDLHGDPSGDSAGTGDGRM